MNENRVKWLVFENAAGFVARLVIDEETTLAAVRARAEELVAAGEAERLVDITMRFGEVTADYEADFTRGAAEVRAWIAAYDGEEPAGHEITVRNEYKDGEALVYWYRVATSGNPVRLVDVRELIRFIVTNQFDDIVPADAREDVTPDLLFGDLLNDPAACALCTHRIYTVDEFIDMCDACRAHHVWTLFVDLPGDKQQRLAWLAQQPLA